MNVLYNRTDRRLRAFWRLVIHIIAHLAGTGLGSLVGIALIFVMLVIAGQASFGMVSQPEVARTAVNQGVLVLPLLLVLRPLAQILAALLVYALLARFIDRRPLRDFGLRLSGSWWRDLGFGLFLGAFLMALVFVVELALGWVTITTWQYQANQQIAFWPLLFFALANFIMVGISEELFSRGYQLRNMAEGLNLPRIGPRAALLLAYVISSSIFGLLHLGNQNATLFTSFNLIIAGLFLGLAFVLTGSLAIPIGIHITWNFFQGNIFGFPVSGGSSGASLIGIQQSGPAFWTGGVFGPEGGLLGILACLLGMALIWGYVRLAYGVRPALHTRLASYQPASSVELQPAAAGTSEPVDSLILAA